MNPAGKRIVFFVVAAWLTAALAGCGSMSINNGSGAGTSNPPSSSPPSSTSTTPLSASNTNLIFVAGEDVNFQSSGDINPATANLTDQGLQRSLLMASFLQTQVLGSQNVTAVYALEPMTHLETTNNFPDVVSLWTIQQFALLNQVTLSTTAGFEIFSSNGPASAADFFFTGGKFSNQKVLVAWEHNNIVDTVNALLASYYPSGGAPTAPGWPGGDYDTIWTVTLDSAGNLAVSNATCEGIDSAALPAAAPQF